MASMTLYRPGNSGLHALHPLTKLAISGLCVSAAVGLPSPWLALVFFALAQVGLAIWGRLGRDFSLLCLKLVAPIALSLFLIQGFFSPGETPLFHLGPFSLKLEGLEVAFDFSARILVGVAAAMLLMYFTRPDHLAQGLTERGLPHQAAYVFIATLQIIPNFQAKAETILNAQRSRGLETAGSLAHRLRMLIPLVAPLLLGSIVDIDERAIALEARGFTAPGDKTNLHELRDSASQGWLRAVLIVGMLALPVWRILGGQP